MAQDATTLDYRGGGPARQRKCWAMRAKRHNKLGRGWNGEGRRRRGSSCDQIRSVADRENPMIPVPVGYAPGYVPGRWLHGRTVREPSTEKRMDLLLIVLILVLLFGGGFGYRRWGYGGGIGIGGILLIVLVVYLLLGRGRF
jgi:hypothetical protein